MLPSSWFRIRKCWWTLRRVSDCRSRYLEVTAITPSSVFALHLQRLPPVTSCQPHTQTVHLVLTAANCFLSAAMREEGALFDHRGP